MSDGESGQWVEGNVVCEWTFTIYMLPEHLCWQISERFLIGGLLVYKKTTLLVWDLFNSQKKACSRNALEFFRWLIWLGHSNKGFLTFLLESALESSCFFVKHEHRLVWNALWCLSRALQLVTVKGWIFKNHFSILFISQLRAFGEVGHLF